MKNFKSLLFSLGLLSSAAISIMLYTQNQTIQAAQVIQTTQSAKIIPRQLLFGNPQKAAPQISPDGTKLAYLAPDQNNVLNVWVRSIENQAGDRQITSEKKRGVSGFLWQLDNSHILYTQNKDGDENDHLYQTDVETTVTKDLTPYEGIKVGIVEYDTQFPDEMLIQMNQRDPALYDVYRLNLGSGQLQLDTENPGAVFGWMSDNHLAVRAAQSYTQDGSLLVQVRDTVDAPWRELITIDPSETGSAVGFSPDDSSMYLVSSLEGNTQRLLQLDIATGKRKVLAEDSQYDLENVMTHPTTHALEAVGVDREKYEWIILDPQLIPDFEYLSQVLQTPFRITSKDISNQNWVIASISDLRPTHFYLYHRNLKKLDFLFSTQPVLEDYQLSQITPISFQARDGMQLYGYLTLPVGESQKNLPTVLLVHGGPWARDYWGFNPTVQWLANRGYAVLQINFRGSSGYGKEYLNAGDRQWGAKMHTDLLDGKQWMIDKGFANPEKVAIYGGSYGGYATLVGLAFTPDAFCCGVDIVGPSNLITLLQTLPPYWSPLKSDMDRRVGSLETDMAFLKERSPLFRASEITKPLLIAQGANDPRVKQAESDQIVEVMRQNHLFVEYLLFKDEGHGFARPENRLRFFTVAEDFLAKYLGGKQETP